VYDRVNARVTQTVNAKFGPGAFGAHHACDGVPSLTLFSDGIRYSISGEVGFQVKGAAGETVKFDLVASEVVPGESHNPTVATSSDSTSFHVHITPEVAQSFATHMKFRYTLSVCGH
jgi:hypothetical protein